MHYLGILLQCEKMFGKRKSASLFSGDTFILETFCCMKSIERVFALLVEVAERWSAAFRFLIQSFISCREVALISVHSQVEE